MGAGVKPERCSHLFCVSCRQLMSAFQGWVMGAELAKTKRIQVAKALTFFRQGAVVEAWLAWRQALLDAADERSKLAKVQHLNIS